MIGRLPKYIAPHHCFECGKIGIILCLNCKYDIIDEMFSGRVVRAAIDLASLLDDTLLILPRYTVIVTVPIYLMVRGYDHTLLLAREFAKRNDAGW